MAAEVTLKILNQKPNQPEITSSPLQFLPTSLPRYILPPHPIVEFGVNTLFLVGVVPYSGA